MGARIILLAATMILILTSIVSNSPEQNLGLPTKILKIDKSVLSVEIASTTQEVEIGLSNRTELEKNSGMLFVFEKEGNHGFWMKDMKFNVDMIWIDKNKKIIYMESNVEPQTYPKIFGSDVTSLFVLETPAGFLLGNNIKIGDSVAF
jgi:uncharacterized protein